MGQHSLFVLCLFPFCVASVLASSAVLKSPNDFIQIGVLFEALCPDSVRFLLGPLSDAHDEFGQRVRFEFVPFGKAVANEKDGTVICQHGKYECQINKFLSCAIRYIENPLPFTVCLESQLELSIYRRADPTDWKQSAADCFLLMDLESDTIAKIRSCDNGHEGKELQMAAGKRTYSITPDPMTFVPWILWNNSSFSDVQEQSRRDLKSLICKHFEGANIDQCNGKH